MSKPSGSVEHVKAIPGYVHVTNFQLDVWHGGPYRAVVRHVETGTLWAMDVHVDDGYRREVGDWYEVVERTTTVIRTTYERE